MGLLGKMYKWFMERPRFLGIAASAASSPLMAYTYLKYRETGIPRDDYLAFLSLLSPLWSFPVFSLLGHVLCAFTYESADHQRTRFGDYAVVRELAREVNRNKPEISFKGVQKVGISLENVVSELKDDSPQGLQRSAKKSGNAGVAIEAAIRNFEKGSFDDALECVRDAFDFLNGKKPNLGAYFMGFNFYEFGCFISRKLFLRDMRTYMASATLASVHRPAEAWLYSALGKKVADKFNTRLRKEMYVFHALLATAQNRSDEESSWSDAFRVLQESPEWQRVGESRSVVRILKNSKFFANTLIFKDAKSRGLLEKGAKDYRTLVERVSDVVVPAPLYVSSEPNADGRYTLVMRLLPGKNLLELRKDGKQIPLDNVVEKLAEIHARMPKELPEMKLAYKLRSKLLVKELGISHKQALNIVRNYRPVYNAIKENAVWVYNKDAHLENWLDCNGKLGVIDCEAEYLVPAHYDFANVFGLDDDISSDRLAKYINKYTDKAKVENLPVNQATFVRGVYNSFIDRMLSFSSAWSSPTRPSLHGERKKALNRAVKAIDIIRLVDSEYYESNKYSYDALQLELLNISAKM